MTADINIVELPVRPSLVIKDVVGTLKLGRVMGPAYGKIANYLKEKNVECSEENVPFCIYRNIDWERVNKKGFFATLNMMFFHKWELEMGIPVPSEMEGTGDIQPLSLPAGRFVKAVHKGPYMKVGDTYKRMVDFAREKQLQFSNYSMEFYKNDPRTTPQAELLTDVYVPLND